MGAGLRSHLMCDLMARAQRLVSRWVLKSDLAFSWTDRVSRKKARFVGSAKYRIKNFRANGWALKWMIQVRLIPGFVWCRVVSSCSDESLFGELHGMSCSG